MVKRCLCVFTPPSKLSSACSVVLVQTARERDHPKNSGALLRIGLERVESVYVELPSHHQPCPLKFEHLKNTLNQIWTTQRDHVGVTLLYPQVELFAPPLQKKASDLFTGPLAGSLAGSLAAHSSDISRAGQRLIVLDMTWGHSQRLLSLVPEFTTLPRFSMSSSEINDARHLFSTLTREREELTAISSSTLPYSSLRSGKRRETEISTFEATLFTLYRLDTLHNDEFTTLTARDRVRQTEYLSLWKSYQRWIASLLAQRSLRYPPMS